jgi:hypothetical protein
MRRLAALGAIFVGLVASRLCHVKTVWTDGDYHLAAAVQLLRGGVLYRDFWFDKPPLTPLLYLAFGARPGATLMIASAFYLFAACLLVYWIARRTWGEREGLFAALLLAWALIFYIPAAVIPLAPDLAMLMPHVAAVALLIGGLPVAAGLAAGVAFFFNVKGLFVLAVCLLWQPKSWGKVLAGFCAVAAVAALALVLLGAWTGYVGQAWKWSLAYAGSPIVARPYLNGLLRTGNWLGFHSAMAAGALIFFLRTRGPLRRTAAMWIALSAVSVCLGLRFAPRYFFQVLPALAIFGASGVALALKARPKLAAVVLALLLLVPGLRFGTRYVRLALDLAAGRVTEWTDLTLDQDNQAVARIVGLRARRGDTLMVWGYRPGIYAYAGLRAGARPMDSQPLTGVPADRHFFVTDAILPEWALANRRELAHAQPAFIVDSLSFFNPKLGMDQYPELAEWLKSYRMVGWTTLSVVYERTRP